MDNIILIIVGLIAGTIFIENYLNVATVKTFVNHAGRVMSVRYQKPKKDRVCFIFTGYIL